MSDMAPISLAEFGLGLLYGATHEVIESGEPAVIELDTPRAHLGVFEAYDAVRCVAPVLFLLAPVPRLLVNYDWHAYLEEIAQRQLIMPHSTRDGHYRLCATTEMIVVAQRNLLTGRWELWEKLGQEFRVFLST